MLRFHQPSADRAFAVVSAVHGSGTREAVAAAYAQVADMLSATGMQIVQERIFGSRKQGDTIRQERRRVLQAGGVAADGPLSLIEGAPMWGEGFAGAILHLISKTGAGHKVEILNEDGVVCGRSWQSGAMRYYVLQDVQPPVASVRKADGPAEQTRSMFDRASKILQEHGASYANVVRTWCYLSNILNWYGDFNRVRNEMYGQFGLMPGPDKPRLLLPASTGVSADNSGGAACSMDVLAVVAKDDASRTVRCLSNPHQKEAFNYGSAFSRGAVIETGHDLLMEISGTAAIDEAGRSQYPGDIRGQIRCTLERISTLLAQEKATLADIAAATVFVKKGQYADEFLRIMDDMDYSDFPGVCVISDICRDELLFEIDAEAVIRRH